MYETLVKIWPEVLLKVQNDYNVTDVSFNTFLQPLEPFTVEEDNLIVLFQNEYNQMGLNFIKNKYGLPLQVVIEEMTGVRYEISFILASDAGNFSLQPKTPSASVTANNYKDTHLKAIHTFDTFVVGSNNQFAHTASLSVAESPGSSFNPLYIYGGPGLGKTHLMHAIGNYIISQSPETKVLYVTSEEFLNEVIESIRTSNNNVETLSKLRNKYRSVDVLLIDDIQYIIGRDSTQNEFFNTFNTLHREGKQIVISSDRPPKELETLDERFKSRFTQGLMADISIPDYETRMAILRKKTEAEHVTVNADILDYIAENIKSNIREIEGALNKILALIILEKKVVDLEMAKTELASFISPNKAQEITPQVIIEIVADHYKISIDQMCSSKRTREISEPRQIAMYLCKDMTEYPFQAIGTLLGGKDHSTVIHGVNKVSDRYKEDEEFKQEIDDIKKKIKKN